MTPLDWSSSSSLVSAPEGFEPQIHRIFQARNHPGARLLVLASLEYTGGSTAQTREQVERPLEVAELFALATKILALFAGAIWSRTIGRR